VTRTIIPDLMRAMTQILIARAGSISAARRAGSQLAATTTTRSTATAVTSVTGCHDGH